MGSPKIYHWKCGRYDLLTLADSEEYARLILRTHVRGVHAVLPEFQEILDTLEKEPTYVAEENYPIVLGI